MKRCFEFILVLILMISMDSLFSYLEVPIRVGDLIIIGLSILVILISGSILKATEGEFLIDAQKNDGVKRILLDIILTIFFVFLGGTITLIGLSDPLTVLTSIKGSAHGYSLAIMGVSIIFAAGSILYVRVSSKNA